MLTLGWFRQSGRPFPAPRTSVVGIFPNESSYVRLVTMYLMEYAEDWSVSRAYLGQESIAATLTTAA
jgi:putative transposase